MSTTTLQNTGMTCGACRFPVENALVSVAGVEHVEVDIETATAVVHGKGVEIEALIQAAEREGYSAQSKSDADS